MVISYPTSENLSQQTMLSLRRINSLFSSMVLTMTGGVIVAGSAAYFIFHFQNINLFWWVAAIFAVHTARLLYRHSICKSPHFNPERALTVLRVSSFCLGILWSFLPVMTGVENKDLNYVLFLMAGNCAGAMIQNVACQRIVQLFVIPQMTVILVMTAFSHQPAPLLIGFNLLYMTLLILRGAKIGETMFLNSHRTAIEATQMAEVLLLANREINTKNAALAILAHQDPMTQLSNHGFFHDSLNQKVAKGQEQMSLILLDLDRFKHLNDTFGYAFGDKVLVEIARQIRLLAPHADVLARLGGDEFGIVFRGAGATSNAANFSQTLFDLLSKPILISGTFVPMSCSIGVASFPKDCRQPSDIYTCTEAALYEAKQNGRRCLRVFDDALKYKLERKTAIENALEAALSNGDVCAFFQPQVNLSTNELAGFEALARWTHPTIGPVSPPEIVSAAQAMQIPHLLTQRIARDACRLLRQLDKPSYTNVKVAINVSPQEFLSYSPADIFIEVAREYCIDPQRLEIEITEETLLDIKSASNGLKALENAGFKLAIDDFGMGHSSLSHMIDLNVDCLKVDRSFVNNITNNMQNQALVSMLVRMARSLNKSIIVEGIENMEDAETVRLLGCRIAQGFFIARPMSMLDAKTWSEKRLDLTLQKLTA